MNSDRIQATIDDLDDLLDDERQALLAGELENIARLHDRKTQLIEELRQLDLKDQEKLRDLSKKVGRNQELLSSALDGIRAVARRLSDVRQAREKIETYDASGKKQSISTSIQKNLEKRA